MVVPRRATAVVRGRFCDSGNDNSFSVNATPDTINFIIIIIYALLLKPFSKYHFWLQINFVTSNMVSENLIFG
jgi:hypothetical protein